LSRNLVFSVYGYGFSIPIAILNEPLLGRLYRDLLFEARRGLTEEALAKILSPAVVNDIISVYTHLGILIKDGNKLWTTIPLFSNEEKKPLMREADRIARSMTKYISRHLREIINQYRRTSLPRQGLEWRDVSFTLIGGMLLDQYLFRTIHERNVVPLPPLRPDGGKWYLWCLEDGTGSPYEYWVSMISSPIGGCACIWIRGMKRSYVHIYGEALRLAMLLAEGVKTRDELMYRSALPADFVHDTLNKWLERGLLEAKDDEFRHKFPILLKPDVSVLSSAFRRMCGELVENILRRNISVLLKLKHRLGYEHIDDAAFLVMMFHAIKQFTVSRLIELGILPEPPKPIPTWWGFWVWCLF